MANVSVRNLKPNSFDPKKILEKLNMLDLEYSLEPFGWQMPFKLEHLFVEATWLPFTGNTYFNVKCK